MTDVKLTALRRSVLEAVAVAPGSDSVEVSRILRKPHHWAGPHLRWLRLHGLVEADHSPLWPRAIHRATEAGRAAIAPDSPVQP